MENDTITKGSKMIFPLEPILLVDDETHFLESLKSTLRLRGINNVELCNSSTEVLLRLKRKRYSLILLDIIMPGINGDQLLEKILLEYPHMKIIMLTACEGPQTAFNCINRGAVDYLVKPCETPKLLEKIHMALQGTREFSPEPPSSPEPAYRFMPPAQEKPHRIKPVILPTFIELEAGYYKELLTVTDGNQAKAALMAGLHPRTFNDRLKRVKEKLAKSNRNFNDIPKLTDLFH